MTNVVFISGSGIENKFTKLESARVGPERSKLVLANPLPGLSAYQAPEEGINLGYMKKEDVSTVVIHQHGNVTGKDKSDKDVDAKFAWLPELIKGKEFTIDCILALKDKFNPSHFEVVGCHQGAVIEDLKRNVDKFDEGTSFFIPSSAKYSIYDFGVVKNIEEKLELFAQTPKVDKATLFAKQITKNPETSYFAKVIQDKTTLEKKLIIFKSVGPKTVKSVKDLGSFFASSGIEGETTEDTCLITVEGDTNSPEYISLFQTIKKELDENIKLFTSSQFQQESYATKALPISAQRGKFEVAEEWIKKIPSYNDLPIKSALQTSVDQGHKEIAKHLLSKFKEKISPIVMTKLIARTCERISERKLGGEIVDLLLENIDNEAKTILIKEALQEENIPCLKYLLDKGLDITINMQYRTHNIFDSKSPKMIEFVEKNRESLEIHYLKRLDKKQITEAMVLDVINKQQVDKLKIILEKNIDLNKIGVSEHGGVLHAAVRCKNLELVNLLLEHGADVHSTTDWGATPLYLAAGSGFEGIVESLLKYGSNPDHCDNIGRSILSWAVSDPEPSEEIIKLLLENIAPHALGKALKTLEEKNIQGNIKDLITSTKPEILISPEEHEGPYIAARHWKNSPQNHSYSRRDAEKENNEGHTALHFAADKKDYDLAKWLLSRDANPAAADKDGFTPLYFAVKRGDLEMIKLLLDAKYLGTNYFYNTLPSNDIIFAAAAAKSNCDTFKLLAEKAIYYGYDSDIRKCLELATNKDAETFKFVADCVRAKFSTTYLITGALEEAKANGNASLWELYSEYAPKHDYEPQGEIVDCMGLEKAYT